jgi:hypothetical protein
MHRAFPDTGPSRKAARQPSGTHALPDISILESRPTPESGFDIRCKPQAIMSGFSRRSQAIDATAMTV